MRRGLLIQLNNRAPACLCPLISAQIAIGRFQRAQQIPAIGHLQVWALHRNEIDLIVRIQCPVFFAQSSPSFAACQQRIGPGWVIQNRAEHCRIRDLLVGKCCSIWLLCIGKASPKRIKRPIRCASESSMPNTRVA